MKEEHGQRLGVLGGTFDPVHRGHIALALQAKADLSLEKVLLVPAGITPHKNNAFLAGKQHRLQMVRLAIEGIDGLAVCPYEIEKDDVAYTCDTLAYLQSVYPGASLTYICGSDILADLSHWRNPQEILKRCELAVYTRGSAENVLPQAERLHMAYDAHITLFFCKIMEVSSTEVRRMLHTGEPCENYLDRRVLRYIQENGLYRENCE